MSENNPPKPGELPTAENSAEPAEPGPRPDRGAGLGSLVGALARRGREELERAASGWRVRLDLRQLRRDREAMYQKLGREARSLLEGGEIQHPGLARGLERIIEIDRKIAKVEAEMSLAGIPDEPEQERDP